MKFILLFFPLLLNTVFAETTPNELVIKLKSGHKLPSIKNINSVQNLFENIYILRTNHLDQLEAALKHHPAIIYAERNLRSKKRELAKLVPLPIIDNLLESNSPFNDPEVGRLWGFDDASNYGVSVNAAYKIYGHLPTTPIIVAVVDTGVDIQHEDLKDNIWINSKEIPHNDIDDDNNGYIDDINGINTLQRDAKGHATMDMQDTYGHGSHVSGIIGAKQNNGIGIAGIASNVKIMGIRTVPNDGDETDIDVAEAFVYAAKNGARIINCSFGKKDNEGHQLIPDTLKYIGEKYGVLVVAAAGNDSSDIDQNPTYPANHPSENLLVVASTQQRGRLSYFSNYGLINVDVAAPGTGIYSTTPGNHYEAMSGTSMATPVTVGVAAEILSHYPFLTVSQLKKVLINSVTPMNDFKYKMVSGGRIDLLKGLEYASNMK